jgi:putative chitinase
MVSADTVLTAAHCLHAGTRSGRPHRAFQVIPARNVGAAPFGRCQGTQGFILRGWADALTPEESRYYDLGALKLDCKVGEQTGWLGVRALTDGETDLPTTVHGYAADKAPPGRQWISDDRIRLLWALKGFYQNDTFGGTSGSPVFSTDMKGVLIGVHTNGLHGEPPWSTHNAFTRITTERLARIHEWIGF